MPSPSGTSSVPAVGREEGGRPLGSLFTALLIGTISMPIPLSIQTSDRFLQVTSKTIVGFTPLPRNV